MICTSIWIEIQASSFRAEGCFFKVLLKNLVHSISFSETNAKSPYYMKTKCLPLTAVDTHFETHLDSLCIKKHLNFLFFFLVPLTLFLPLKDIWQGDSVILRILFQNKKRYDACISSSWIPFSRQFPWFLEVPRCCGMLYLTSHLTVSNL